jgi:hypothetical protein
MSLRLSFAAAALLGVVLTAAPASAVMQVVPLPDPNAPASSATPPDGLFDKTFGDHWQKPGTDSQQQSPFHFTVSGSHSMFGDTAGDPSVNRFSVSGSSSGFSGPTDYPSALDAAKQPLSEFSQPMQGSSFPMYNH